MARDYSTSAKVFDVWVIPDTLAASIFKHYYDPGNVYIEVMFEQGPACWVKVNPRDTQWSYCLRCQGNRCPGAHRAASEVLLRQLADVRSKAAAQRAAERAQEQLNSLRQAVAA